jgi:hypothetical protein
LKYKTNIKNIIVVKHGWCILTVDVEIWLKR